MRDEPEWRIDLKTRAALVAPLTSRIAALHDYDTPEIITLPITSGSPAYLAWLTTETRS